MAKPQKPLKKLSDITDDNGTSLQAYADVLVDKADAAGLRVIFLFISNDIGFKQIANVPLEEQADVFEAVAKTLREEKPIQTRRTR